MNSADFTLRPAQPGDLADIQHIGLEADERFVAAGHPELADGEAIPATVVLQATGQGRLLVAEVGGAVVGWVYVGWIGGELSIGQISVAPSSGRRGIGSALLGAVILKARAGGEASIVLNTQADVAWNRPWYERHGFVVVEREEWTPGMETVAEDQSRGGLDWSSRVHMRLILG